VSKIGLPADLVAFLRARKQLEYDSEKCEAGKLEILAPSELKFHRFPVETSGSDSFEQDPHFPEANSYLVLGVNLVKSCRDYEPVGLLIWLPVEKRYGIWDSSHCTIRMFPADATWSGIAADPVRYVNAGWGLNDLVTEELIPWKEHPYSDDQVYEPQPA
jgi:hypothetical protein